MKFSLYNPWKKTSDNEEESTWLMSMTVLRIALNYYSVISWLTAVTMILTVSSRGAWKSPNTYLHNPRELPPETELIRNRAPMLGFLMEWLIWIVIGFSSWLPLLLPFGEEERRPAKINWIGIQLNPYSVYGIGNWIIHWNCVAIGRVVKLCRSARPWQAHLIGE